MLELRNIRKNYIAGDNEVQALRGIDLKFRESEFVSILGPSGCGKTTLLNIIGGLDRFTDGNLLINGIETTQFRDRDWDAYRNNSIGFVFQTYNLISHQSVAANVEMSLTLSGISKSERRARAKEVLTRVGLGDQINKKPNQLSGGQMQRVAIARALINDPDILLADEPTGSLDSETSEQIMQLLKEISAGKLVIMVTHNPDLAERYSTRIIKLLDGRVVSDSDTVLAQRDEESEFKFKRTSMSFFTALALSVSNLMTKKTRTILTAFAGSIGIIGIALIIALSNGLQNYIDNVERGTLSGYPITIENETMDITGMLDAVSGDSFAQGQNVPDKINVSRGMSRLLNMMKNTIKKNDLAAFKAYIEENSEEIEAVTTSIEYKYNVDRNLFIVNETDNDWFQVNPSKIFIELYQKMYNIDISSMTLTGGMGGMASMSMSNMDRWHTLISNNDFLSGQYEILAGKMPEGPFEAVLITSADNAIPDMLLYTMGIKGATELNELIETIMDSTGEKKLSEDNFTLEYSDIIGLEYALVPSADFYIEQEGGTWVDSRTLPTSTYRDAILESADKLKIVGVIKPSEDAAAVSTDRIIGFSTDVDTYLINKTAQSPVVTAQLSNPDYDIFTGLPFADSGIELTLDEYLETLRGSAYFAMIEAQIKNAREQGIPDAQILMGIKAALQTTSTYDDNMNTLGYRDFDKPSSIEFYASSFDNKDKIADFITKYNATHPEENEITYTDYIGLLLSSVTDVINAISAILIAFVSISLIVSSIMIGIITYISVLERTREIGVLRAIGAAKRDISRVFNAETLFIGFSAGAIGIIITFLICIPANIIIKNVTDVPNLARLPIAAAIGLIIISMLLTFIAGLIPSRVAAKKDPVVALRTE